jgi:hypothetical protein
MYEIESREFPYFNDYIKSAIETADGYYDMTSKNSNYIYTDGNHLYKESAKLVSSEVAKWISKLN